MNPITQRFFDALKAAGLSAYRISEDIPTISQARISNARTGKNEIGLDVVSSVCSFYPSINSDYIITGNGTPIHEAEMNTRQRVGIPLVSQYAYGGYLTGYGDAEYLQSLPLIDFIPDRSMSGNYLAFEVRGDSMDDGTKDGYEQGEILICREVAPHLWKDSKLHIHRRDFVIVHADGVGCCLSALVLVVVCCLWLLHPQRVEACTPLPSGEPPNHPEGGQSVGGSYGGSYFGFNIYFCNFPRL